MATDLSHRLTEPVFEKFDLILAQLTAQEYIEISALVIDFYSDFLDYFCITLSGRLCFRCVHLSICLSVFRKAPKVIYGCFWIFMLVGSGQMKFWKKSLGLYSRCKKNSEFVKVFFLPLFHQRTKPRPCPRPLIVDSLWQKR